MMMTRTAVFPLLSELVLDSEAPEAGCARASACRCRRPGIPSSRSLLREVGERACRYPGAERASPAAAT